MQSLLKLLPETARRVNANGSEDDIPLTHVHVGHLLRIRRGEKAPVDGTVIDGNSAIDESMLTGEAIPETKRVSDKLIGATLNTHGALIMRSERVGPSTVLAQIVNMVTQAQRSRAPLQRMADTVTAYFVIRVISIALLTFLGWGFLAQNRMSLVSVKSRLIHNHLKNHAIYILLQSIHSIVTFVLQTRSYGQDKFEEKMNTPFTTSLKRDPIRMVNPPKLNAASSQTEDPFSKIVAIGQSRIITEGTVIHRAGDHFRSVFFLRSGVAKRCLTTEDGREQVLGFPMSGEIIGLEAIDSFVHTTTVICHDHCVLIEIPYHLLEKLAASDHEVAAYLFRAMSSALRDEHGWLATLGLLSSEGRVAAFLMDLSRRFAARGYSSTQFSMRMTRAEIGCFLGLTIETVSRVFSKFQKIGLLNVARKEIEILDPLALKTLAHIQKSLH
jgi:CRP-like cAMP-binding protein